MLGPQWISLEGIGFNCIIGVTERERQVPQEISVDVAVRIDFGEVAAGDSIAGTVDYRRLAESIVTAGAASRFQLVETLAAHLCETVFRRFPAVQAVRLAVEKVHALRAARSVKVVVSVRRPRATRCSES